MLYMKLDQEGTPTPPRGAGKRTRSTCLISAAVWSVAVSAHNAVPPRPSLLQPLLGEPSPRLPLAALSPRELTDRQPPRALNGPARSAREAIVVRGGRRNSGCSLPGVDRKRGEARPAPAVLPFISPGCPAPLCRTGDGRNGVDRRGGKTKKKKTLPLELVPACPLGASWRPPCPRHAQARMLRGTREATPPRTFPGAARRCQHCQTAPRAPENLVSRVSCSAGAVTHGLCLPPVR